MGLYTSASLGSFVSLTSDKSLAEASHGFVRVKDC